MSLLAALGAGVAGAWVALYYVYAASVIARPELAARLEAPLRSLRPPTLAVAVALGLGAGIHGAPAAALLTLVAAGVAVRRQHLVLRAPQPAPPPRPDAWAAELPSGERVGIDDLWRLRVVSVGDVTLVGCGLARSVSAFRAPGPLAAGLPLAVGFELVGTGRWGVDGAPRDGGAPITAVPVVLRRGERPLPARRVRVPGADAPADAEPGPVRDGTWSPLDDRPAPLHLARWAAAQAASAASG